MSLDITLQETASAVACPPALEERLATTWLTPGRFALFLGLLVFAAFPGVLLGTQAFVFRDFGLFGYPLAMFHRQSFWRGEIPLWNPLNNCGVPFLAQWNTMALYPPTLIYLLLPMPWSVSFFCLAHLFWGGVGMYSLATNWTHDRLAAALAGVIFAFNGVMLSSLIWPSQIATFAWVPWVIWLVQRAWLQGGRQIVWGVLSGSMQMLAGGPETILLTWCVLALLALGDWLRLRELGSRSVLRLGGMVVLVALVCAAQLLPFLQLLSHSQRDSGFGSAMWSLPSSGWANLLVPLFRTTRCSWGVYLQSGQQWISSYYPGVGTIFLAFLALRGARDWRPFLIAALIVLSFTLALGENGFVYRALRGCVPALGFARFPVKFILLALGLAPLLAAFGLKSLTETSRRLGAFELGVAVVLVLLIGVIIALDWNAPGDGWCTTCQNGLSRAGFLILLLLVMPRCVSPRGRNQVLWGCSLVIVFWLDLLTHAPSQNPTASPSVYAPDAVKAGRNWTAEPRLGEARAMASPLAQSGLYQYSITNFESNYLIYRMALFMDCNLIENLPQVYGFFAMLPSDINLATYAPFVWTNQDFSPLFDFIGVAQVASGPNLDWTSRPTAMPMVTIGQKAVFTDDRTALGAFAQTNLDFRKIVFLPSEARGEVSALSLIKAQVVSTNFANQTVSIQTDAPAQTMVVIAQTYYPAWKAYVDGQATKLWRANYAFQAVQVPAGRHRIELRYEDKLFLIGALLSGLGIVICVSLWLIAHYRGLGVQEMRSLE